MVTTLDTTITDVMVVINFMYTFMKKLIHTFGVSMKHLFVCLFFYPTRPVSFCDASGFKVG